MLTFNASAFVRIFGSLQILESALTIESDRVGSPFKETIVDLEIGNGPTMAAIMESCLALDLHLSLDHAKRITRDVVDERLKYGDFARALKELSARIMDEMQRRQYFYVHPDKAKYFGVKEAFGPEVAVAFPSAIVNIEEAGNCLALARGTACVYHLMRVMESGLKAASRALGIPYAPSWESHLLQIDARVNAKYRRKGVKWKRDEPFFRDVSAHLYSVKAAWRNPTMHIVRDYTPEQAEEIYQAVRMFIRHLATKLHD